VCSFMCCLRQKSESGSRGRGGYMKCSCSVTVTKIVTRYGRVAISLRESPPPCPKSLGILDLFPRPSFCHHYPPLEKSNSFAKTLSLSNPAIRYLMQTHHQLLSPPGTHASLSSSPADKYLAFLLPLAIPLTFLFRADDDDDLSLSIPPSEVLPPSDDTARFTRLRFPPDDDDAAPVQQKHNT